MGGGGGALENASKYSPLLVLAVWYTSSVLNNMVTKQLLNTTVPGPEEPAQARFNFPLTLCAVCLLAQALLGTPHQGRSPSVLQVLPYSAFVAGAYFLHRRALQLGSISVVLPTKVTASILITFVLSQATSLEKITSSGVVIVLLAVLGTAIANYDAYEAAFSNATDESTGQPSAELIACIATSLVCGFCGSLKTVIGSMLRRTGGFSSEALYSKSRFWAAVLMGAAAVHYEGADYASMVAAVDEDLSLIHI